MTARPGMLEKCALSATLLVSAATLTRAQLPCPGWVPSHQTPGVLGGNAIVRCALAYDPDGFGPMPRVLIVAGNFTSIGGTPANNIAQWDGSSWAPLGNGFTFVNDQEVRALAYFDEDGPGPGPAALYAGGDLSASNQGDLARWDGAAWALLPYPRGTVNALAVLDDGSGAALYVGGEFGLVGNPQVSGTRGIARWNGLTWSGLGNGIPLSISSSIRVNALAQFNDVNGPRIYVGGAFSQNFNIFRNLVSWNGSSWSHVGVSGEVHALAEFDPDGLGPMPSELIVGGAFPSPTGQPNSSSLARWTGSGWQNLGIPGTPEIRTLAVTHQGSEGQGRLWIGGDNQGPSNFWNSDGVSVFPLWTVQGDLHALASFGPTGAAEELYCLGDFVPPAGGTQQSPRSLAKWRPDGRLSMLEHPLSVVACQGSTTAMFGYASGSEPVTYQWRKNGAPISDGGVYTGTQTTTLTISNITHGDFGSYELVATNPCGSLTSAVATLMPDLSDTDLDGVPDCTDNCPKHANPNQLDVDMDGVGDQCEYICPAILGFRDDLSTASGGTTWSTMELPPFGGQLLASMRQSELLGGNINEFWRIWFRDGGSPGPNDYASVLAGAVYDPSVEGALGHIEYACDLRGDQHGPPSTPASTVALLLEQNGNYYAGQFDTFDNAWSTSTHSAIASDFSRILGNGPANPDFSFLGAPIQFGLILRGYPGIHGHDSQLDFDNWGVTLSSLGWRPELCCDAEAASLDLQGNPIYPPDIDPNFTPVVELVDALDGDVEALHPGIDVSTDTWISSLCDATIGEEPLPGGMNPTSDILAALAGIGITGVTPTEIAAEILAVEKLALARISQEPDNLRVAGPVTGPTPFAPPAAPHAPDPSGCYRFGGRDMIFIHGLDTSHIVDRLSGVPGANVDWVQPTTLPGSIDNPEFYGTGASAGYYKAAAEAYWREHIERFLIEPGMRNRYLVVAYPSNARLDVGIRVILTQIADAMRHETDVIDLSGNNDKSRFGTPSFVMVTHSTGGLAASAAMAAALRYPSLQAQFIPSYCKAHIAFQGAMVGSRLATVAVALSALIDLVAPPWMCDLAEEVFRAFGHPLPASFNWNDLGEVVADSVMVDLLPLVAKYKWGNFIDATPVRTVTVAGGHPSALTPLKQILHPGFDDGVLALNSQVGNPATPLVWPMGFLPYAVPPLFDWGLFRSSFENSPFRAIGYFVDQTFDKYYSLTIHPDDLVAGTATPWLSPRGMVQPVAFPFKGSPWDCRRRFGNHFSFIQSASDHSEGTTDVRIGTVNRTDYQPTVGTERNWEETRVVTDADIYQAYTPFNAPVWQGVVDDQPLLGPCRPGVSQWTKGQYVRFPAIKSIIPLKFKWRKIWIWKRTYLRATESETLVQGDYVYNNLLVQVCSLPGNCTGGGGGLGVVYCTSNPNSTGAVSAILASGSNLVANNDFHLDASNLPPNSFGYFINSRTQGLVHNPGGSQGNLCLSGGIGRRVGNVIFNSGASGTGHATANLTAMPQPTGPVAVVAGETWNFQCWHRDSVAGTSTSNFTDGVSVLFQ